MLHRKQMMFRAFHLFGSVSTKKALLLKNLATSGRHPPTLVPQLSVKLYVEVNVARVAGGSNFKIFAELLFGVPTHSMHSNDRAALAIAVVSRRFENVHRSCAK